MTIEPENIQIGCNDFTDGVKLYFQDLKKCRPISRELERELLSKAKKGDINARNKIIESNLRFVFDTAKKYKGQGVDISDLIYEGNQGLVWAITKYDMSKDIKFITYAVWWIQQKMHRLIDKKRKEETIFIYAEDIPNNGSNSRLDYADDTELDEEEENTISVLDAVDLNDDETEEEQNNSKLLNKLMSVLDNREKYVIQECFGIDGHKKKEIKDISKELNLSCERTRQIKVKAMDLMRAQSFDLDEEEVQMWM